MIISAVVYSASLLLGLFFAQVISDRIESNPNFL